MDVEDAIQREIEFTTILANSIVARKAFLEHEDAPLDLGCDAEADRLCEIDAKAFGLAIDAIEKRLATVTIKAETSPVDIGYING